VLIHAIRELNFGSETRIMKQAAGLIFRIALFVLIVVLWLWVYYQQFSGLISFFIVVGCIILAFPVVWAGRILLDKQPTPSRAAGTSLFVHYALLMLLGAAIVEAAKTHQAWYGWTIPVPVEIGYWLVIVTSLATLLTVVNLALKGLGAPFAVALSRKLAVDWMYAWTRNPMVLGTLACLLALGVWFQSALFVLWVLLLVTPAWLAFVKFYEESELEIRFGASYLEYRAKTPMLFPRRPKA
jgi:protein-S-isoprenylcysteine O-methyltransferase Ste14